MEQETLSTKDFIRDLNQEINLNEQKIEEVLDDKSATPDLVKEDNSESAEQP